MIEHSEQSELIYVCNFALQLGSSGNLPQQTFQQQKQQQLADVLNRQRIASVQQPQQQNGMQPQQQAQTVADLLAAPSSSSSSLSSMLAESNNSMATSTSLISQGAAPKMEIDQIKIRYQPTVQLVTCTVETLRYQPLAIG